MKKLILMLLVLAGGVLNVSATNQLKGSWDSWNTHDFAVLENDKESVQIETVTVSLSASQTYEFGIQAGSDFYSVNATMTSGNSTDYSLYTGNANTKITTGIAGEYVFRLKWYSGTPHLTVIYPSSETIVVHFENHDSWAAVAGYRYNEYYGKEMNWPGTQIYANPLNSNYYDYTITKNNGGVYNKFKFNNNNNGNETNAIDIDYSASEYWVYYSGSTYVASTTPPASFNYTRGVTEGRFGTICLPYAATVTGATVFKITSKVMDGSTLTGINLTSVDALEAGKAYIFKATGTTLTATLSGNYTDASADYGMMGNVSAASVYVPLNDYVVSNNQIRQVGTADAVTVGRYKGYITLTDIDEATARGLDFIGMDGETTGINEVSSQKAENDEYFNLAGQRVAQPTKGLFIVNGKKVIK